MRPDHCCSDITAFRPRRATLICGTSEGTADDLHRIDVATSRSFVSLRLSAATTTIFSFSVTAIGCRPSRSPKCIRKTRNTFCRTSVSVPLPKICGKTASTHNVSLKYGNRLSSYDQKRSSIWQPSAILNFKNFHIWSFG